MSASRPVSMRVAKYNALPSRLVVGADVGGTWLRLAAVRKGQLQGRVARIPTEKIASLEALADRVARNLLIINAQTGQTIKVLGIGFPCPIDSKGEPIFSPPNLSFGFQGFIKSINEKTGISAFAFNDASAAAWGVAMFGEGREQDVVVWHGLGTGYGMAAIDGEKDVFPSAFEGGHIKVVNPSSPDARVCGCKSAGCIEAYTSGPAMALRFARLKGLDPKSVTGKTVGECFASGDPVATNVITEAMEYFAMALATTHNLTFAGAHVIGGGVVDGIGKPLLPIIKAAIANQRGISFGADLTACIQLSEILAGQEGLLGAALLAEMSYYK